MLRTVPGTGKLLIIMALVALLSSCAGILFNFNAQQEFDQGMSFFNQGNYAEAVPHFRKAAELDPEFGKAYLYLGRSYLNLNKWGDAIAPLRTAFRISPVESRKEVLNILMDAFLGAATSEFRKGNFAKSLDYLREGLSLDPESSHIRNELSNTLISFGSLLLSEGNFTDAITAYSEAAELSPDNTDALTGLAKAFLKNGNFMKALQTIQKARNNEPGNRDLDSLMKDILEDN